MTDQVPAEHAKIDADLDAWGRWSQRRRGGFNSACGSAEGNYRAPWRQWHDPTAEEMMPRPDVRDMLAIDRAIVGLPLQYLELIRCHYFYRLAPRKSRLRLAIAVGAWDEHLFRARQMVINRMKRAGVAISTGSV
jgi:DNA-directed RNA polymerase specialized sigma24 family protein